jgi:predicted DNA-binding transcriptional regulator YafY
MAENFLRYLMLLREIPRAPKRVDTATLAIRLEAHGLNVTRRTLQRDLERLSATFPLVCADQTKPYGWSWVEGSSRERPGPGTDRLRTLGQIARDRLAQSPIGGQKSRRSRGGSDLSVVLRFSDRAAKTAARELCGNGGTRYERGGVRVETIVRDTPELRSWLRSLGADVEIIAPGRLRSEFRALSAKLERMYRRR